MTRSRITALAAAVALLTALGAQADPMVQAVGGQEMVVKYKDGSQKILAPGTPIVTTVPADRSSLKVGEYVFMGANVAPDGSIGTSARIQVSKDGVKPPQ